MPRATWEALRNHIIKERRRKQEEEGKAEENERLKKERENRKMMEATSLDETKKQIVQLEEKLTALKEEKHQLFLTLKKVLNEDENRRRKETSETSHLYPHSAPVFPLTGFYPQCGLNIKLSSVVRSCCPEQSPACCNVSTSPVQTAHVSEASLAPIHGSRSEHQETEDTISTQTVLFWPLQEHPQHWPWQVIHSSQCWTLCDSHQWSCRSNIPLPPRAQFILSLQRG